MRPKILHEKPAAFVPTDANLWLIIQNNSEKIDPTGNLGKY